MYDLISYKVMINYVANTMITLTKSVRLTTSSFIVINQSIRRIDCCTSVTSCQDRTTAVCNWLSVCCGRVDIKLTSISMYFSCWGLNNVRSRCFSSSDNHTRSILSISSDPNISIVWNVWQVTDMVTIIKILLLLVFKLLLAVLNSVR